ncbi:uncharacterized protein LOC121329607 [Polyodon spathula]|uniref:uncharacterized protein LOC121329607 n=1 Tax=Polyodon spathula TaxID=7913 RepID=UPI001B7EE152|nr:uncharacterized protein LOC121329607 [Polyodon spathula]
MGGGGGCNLSTIPSSIQSSFTSTDISAVKGIDQSSQGKRSKAKKAFCTFFVLSDTITLKDHLEIAQLIATAPADSEGAKTNTRCPPKTVLLAARFFTHCRLNMKSPGATVSEDNTALGSLQVSPVAPDQTTGGRWCVVIQGHPGRPNPPSPQAALGQLCTAPWELPSSVGKGITWTRTSNVQTIGTSCTLPKCVYWMHPYLRYIIQ